MLSQSVLNQLPPEERILLAEVHSNPAMRKIMVLQIAYLEKQLGHVDLSLPPEEFKLQYLQLHEQLRSWRDLRAAIETEYNRLKDAQNG
jgi:hypothetical protein